MQGFNSKLVHGDMAHQKMKRDVFGALRTPIYDSVAFEYDSAEEIAEAFEGKVAGHSYSRISNPTIAELESRLTYISKARATICLASGMAAIANTILSICSSGDNILTTKYLFGNTYSLFENTFKSLGIETRYVDLTSNEAIEQHMDAHTRAVFLENITNPHLLVFDIGEISKITSKKDIALIVDNTFMTSYLFDAKGNQVDIEIISTTKSISGGATSVGGAILIYDSNKWDKIPKLKELHSKFGKDALEKKLRKEVYRNFGACLSPHNAYLQILGLETMSLRIDRCCHNALGVAEYLEKNMKVKSVNYPGLQSNKFNEIVQKQFRGQGGSLLTFELDNKVDCFKFINALKMIRRSTNLCDNKSLIIHPSSTIFCEYSEGVKEELGINDRMIRLSVGIEDLNDIIEDIHLALEQL